MSIPHQSAVLADSAGIAAAVSVVSAVQQFSFHEFVGTVAGCLAIAYYVFQFFVWVRNRFNNDGD